MTLKEKLLKRLPKKYWNRFDNIEKEDGLVDDCKYMLYFTDEFTDGFVEGGSYPVKSITEAIDFIKNDLFPVNDFEDEVNSNSEKENLRNSLIDLSNKLESGEFERCNLLLNYMAIYSCSRIKLKDNDILYIDYGGDIDFNIALKNIIHLNAFAVTSKNKEFKEVIDYRA